VGALLTDPQHVGDVEVECPACGDSIAVPVLCEFVPDGPSELSLRCSPNVAPLRDHARAVHGARLSRTARP